MTLDSAGQLTEICEANNIRTEKTNARAFRLGYHKVSSTIRPVDFLEVGVDEDYNDKVINMVGSFSDFDWLYSHLARVNIMLQTTKSPTVSEVGIQEGLRLDDFYAWVWPETFPHDYNVADANMFDGSYCDIRISNDSDWRYMSLYIGECHEIGHTGLRLPDLYGYGYSAYNVLSGITPGSAEFPIVSGNTYNMTESQGILSSHDSGNSDEFKVGNASFMSSCHLWLSPTLAGFIHYRRQDRYWGYWWEDDGFNWGEWTAHGEGKNRIQFLDYTGNPLTNAEVYVYPIVHFNWIGNLNKYFPNQVKFTGTTNSTDGLFTFPTTTSNNWDDWTTSIVEGAESCASPFDRHSGDGTPCDSTGVTKPNYQCAESMLIKVVGVDPASAIGAEITEYHLLPLTELNSAFFAAGGDPGNTATYTIRTSLADSSHLYVSVPNAPDTNNNPIAILSGPSTPVTVSSTFTLSADGSHDGDSGRIDPLWYWWVVPDPYNPDNLRCYQTYGTENTFNPPAYSTPGIYTCKLFVLDGLKISNEASFNVTVVETHEEYQAEDWGWDNGVVESEYAGYTGTGYVNTYDEVGTYIFWMVNVPGPATGTLVFRYANGSSTNRHMTLEVQGNIITSQLDFVTTNAWTNWSESGISSVPLVSGYNVIRIIANTAEGAPNMDRMDIYYTLN